MDKLDTLHRFAARLRGFITEGAHSFCSEEFFDAQARKLFTLQYFHNPVYRQICESHNVSSPSGWRDIPAVPVSAFKEFNVSSLQPAARAHYFQSSGTTQQRRSRHYHCPESLNLYEAAAIKWFDHHLPGNLRIAALTPAPREVPHSSLVHMFEAIRVARASREPFYFANAVNDGRWVLNVSEIKKLLRETSPLLLLGTAFSFVHLLDAIEAIDLPAGSCVMETGGYKNQSRIVPKSELHEMISEKFGVPHANIVTEYGMSELSSQAYDTILGAPQPRTLKFPPWVRTRIISPETGRESAEGILQVFDLANVYSVMALQTEDLARTAASGFELLGRAAASEPRGCSLMPANG